MYIEDYEFNSISVHEIRGKFRKSGIEELQENEVELKLSE